MKQHLNNELDFYELKSFFYEQIKKNCQSNYIYAIDKFYLWMIFNYKLCLGFSVAGFGLRVAGFGFRVTRCGVRGTIYCTRSNVHV